VTLKFGFKLGFKLNSFAKTQFQTEVETEVNLSNPVLNRTRAMHLAKDLVLVLVLNRNHFNFR